MTKKSTRGPIASLVRVLVVAGIAAGLACGSNALANAHSADEAGPRLAAAAPAAAARRRGARRPADPRRGPRRNGRAAGGRRARALGRRREPGGVLEHDAVPWLDGRLRLRPAGRPVPARLPGNGPRRQVRARDRSGGEELPERGRARGRRHRRPGNLERAPNVLLTPSRERGPDRNRAFTAT